MSLEIFLLGPFEIKRDGQLIPEEAWHTRQARQVLKVLITERQHIVPAERLLDWLWPNADPDRAATTLRTAVSTLRRVLEPDRSRYTPSRYVLTQSPGYRFAGRDEVWLDVVEFEALLDAAQDPALPLAQKQDLLGRALALYRDDYLSDDPYVDWALPEREHLAERYLQALADLAEVYAAQGQLAQAIACCRRVLVRDPGREPVVRALMRYQVRAGDTVAALRTYDRCRRHLAEELGVDPSPPSQALHQAILAGDLLPIQAGQPLAAPAPALLEDPDQRSSLGRIFVGREPEMAFLNGLLEQALAGRGALVGILGEAGVGKTRLAMQILQRASQANAWLLVAHCHALEQSLPFAPLAEALQAVFGALPETTLADMPAHDLAQLAQLLPFLSLRLPEKQLASPPGSPEENRRRLVDSLVNIFLHLARRALVMLVDDLHWADEATLTVLGRLARQADHARLLLLVTYRAEEIDRRDSLLEMLDELQRRNLVKVVSLTRLSEADVAAFINQAAGGGRAKHLAAVAAQLHRTTGGNPLFLTETLRAILDRRPDALNGAQLEQLTADPVLREPADQVRDVVLARLARLPAEARALLELAAVIERDFSPDLLEAASVGLADPLPALDLLLKHQFLREVEAGGDSLDFSHHLVRDIVYTSLSGLARRRLHQRLAEALVALYGSQAGPRAAEIAFHYRRAGQAGRARACHFAVQAGDHALRTYGFQQALAHYGEALRLSQHLPPRDATAELIRRAYLGQALAYEAVADWDNVARTYTELEAWATGRGDSRLAFIATRRLASILALIGQFDESAAISARISGFPTPDMPPAVIDMQRRLATITDRSEPLVPASGWPGFDQPPPPPPQAWRGLSESLGSELAPQSLILYGWALMLQGQTAAAEATLQHAAQVARDNAQAGYHVTSYHLLSQLWAGRGDYSQMAHWLQRSLALVEAAPELGWAAIWGRIHQAYMDLRWNQLARAGQRFEQLAAELQGRTAFRTHRLSVQVGLGLLASLQQAWDDAATAFEAALAEAPALYVYNYVMAHLGLAWLLRRRGDLGSARAEVVHALAFAGQRGLLAEYVSAAVEAGRLARAEGRPQAVIPLLRQAETLAEQAGLRSATLSARQALSRALVAAGDLAEADLVRALARADRDAIAATIPDEEDRALFLARPDLAAL